MTGNQSVRLGLMPPLTGIVGIYGEEISRAAMIACQEVNESGGVLGRPLEVIIEDDGSLPESAVRAAERLLDTHGCVALIGNLMTNARIAVAYRVAEPRRVPYLCFSLYEGSVLSRYYFHFAALPNQQIDLMIPYMKRRYGSKMFFCGNNYEWPRGSIDAAKRALEKIGGEIVGEEYFPLGIGERDIRQLFQSVEKSGAHVLVPFFAGSDELPVLTHLHQCGLSERLKVVMSHFDEVMASQLSPEARAGLYSCNSYFMTIASPENKSYLQKLSALSGVSGIWPRGNGLLTNFGEGTYLCVKAFAQAANQSKSLDPESLVDALESVSLVGPQGRVTMDRQTHHARVNSYLARCERDGTLSIVQHFGAIEPVIPERYRHQKVDLGANLDEIRLQSRIVDQMNDAVCMVHALDETIVYVNPAFGRMFGYPSGEILGKTLASLNTDSGARGGEAAAEIDRALYQKGVWRGERPYSKKDGSEIWCAIAISAFTHARLGEVWLVNMSDITARKSAESSLRAREADLHGQVSRLSFALEAAKSGMWEWDPATGEASWGEELWRLFGLEPHRRAMSYETWREIVFEEDLAASERTLADAVKSQREFSYEFRVRGENGALRTILSRGQPLLDVAGKATGRFIGIMMDITERKQAMAVLERAQRLESLGVLAGGIAHDFNNLMTGLFGYLELIKFRSEEGASVSHEVDHAMSAFNRARDLTQQILTFSKGGAPVKSRVDIRQLLREAVKFSLSGSNVTAQFRLDERGFMIDADPQQIKQVIDNLIINAKQAMPAGGKIEIETQKVEPLAPRPSLLPEGAWIRVTISDHGCGIAAEDLPRIFDPFFSTKPKGTGLGLSMVHSIITRHGGFLDVASEPGRGTSMIFYLPLFEDETERPAVGAVVKFQGDQRVLVMDDEVMVQELVSAFLKKIGCRVEIASSGEQAVSAYVGAKSEGRPFDLVILDLTVPGGMGGISALRALKDVDPAVRAIVSSGYSEDPIMADPRAFGFVASLAKPYRFEQLTALLREIFG